MEELDSSDEKEGAATKKMDGIAPLERDKLFKIIERIWKSESSLRGLSALLKYRNGDELSDAEIVGIESLMGLQIDYLKGIGDELANICTAMSAPQEDD